MPVNKQRTLDYMEQEWGTYVERFHRLPEDEQKKRVNEMGYDSLRDLLAHVLAWWQEGMGIVLAIAQEREFERKKYDFDAFNAEAVARYKTWDQTAFMAYFEETRQKMAADLASLEDAVFENRRVKAWLNGIVFHHAREHLLTLSRFLAIDVLKNEWAEYVENFERLDEERKKKFLAEQGFDSFHDLLAHIIGWWEEGLRVITGIQGLPGFLWTEPEASEFNRQMVRKYSSWTREDLLTHYDTVRLAMIDLVANLPNDAFLNPDIESWLAEDVVEHYDGHALPQ